MSPTVPGPEGDGDDGVHRPSFHTRKHAFMSLGAPSTTTVDTGMNGRSSRDAARMP